MPIDFLHEGIILDACCVINIYASGQMRAILNSIPKSVAVAAFVQKREARYIYGNPLGKGDTSKPNERINLQPFIQDKLLIIVSPNSTDENDDAVHFGRSIDTGEAISGAIAKSRNWSIALDDRDAIAFFSATISHIQLI